MLTNLIYVDNLSFRQEKDIYSGVPLGNVICITCSQRGMPFFYIHEEVIKMNDVLEKNELIGSGINIENMIYNSRGVPIMLDSDLAFLFGIPTKRINEAVKNNPKKFPEKFSWKLTEEENKIFLVENFDQKNIETRGGRYKNPRVFTEHGIIMLSTILKSNIAIEISIQIVNTFVNMRHFIINNRDIYKSLNNINNKIIEHDEKINYMFSKFDKKQQLINKNTVYDAYSNILKIIENVKNELIIIDEYADIKLLDLIRNLKYKIILITRNSDRLSNIEIDKYNRQYNNLKVIRNNSFHDRYFILDREEIYLLGTSINNLGEKISTIVKLEDNLLINLLKIVEDIIK